MNMSQLQEEPIRYDDLIIEVEAGAGSKAGFPSSHGDNNEDDEIVVEDLPEEEAPAVHDQLPSVEEAKANLSYQPASNTNKKKKVLIGLGVLAILAATIGIIVAVATSFGKSSKTEVTLSGRAEDVVNFLFENHVTALPALKDRTFPQHKAALFVADGDAYQMDLDASNEIEVRRFIERYVLALVYYHYNGPKWNYQLNFLTAEDHCKWHQNFNIPSGRTIRLGVTCDNEEDGGNGFVTKLHLYQNNLKGRGIPDEVQQLTKLESLHMYFNKEIVGALSADLFSGLTNLKSLGLMDTGMSGIIPETVGQMTKLTTLALGNNQFHGEIPKSIKNLKDLRILGLDDNDSISGNINEMFYGMSKLEALYLENNAFSGQLPTDSKTWPSIQEIDISNNMIDEDLPANILNRPNLWILDIHKNMIDGAFPDDIFQNTKLQVLALQDNFLRSTIPDRLGFLGGLEHFDISRNRFSGTIPDDIITLTNLRYWATSNNPFEEQAVPNLSQMTNLMDIQMKHNNLIGTFPEWIGNLFELELVDFDANELTGTLPTWIGLLRNLNHLLLNRNQLEGNLPTQLAAMTNLDVLLLDGNDFKGETDVMCDTPNFKPRYFTADCYPGRNGERPEVECRCCSTCCIDDDPTCNDFKWTSNVDPVWEYSYLRQSYRFSLENAPADYSKDPNSTPTDPLDDAHGRP